MPVPQSHGGVPLARYSHSASAEGSNYCEMIVPGPSARRHSAQDGVNLKEDPRNNILRQQLRAHRLSATTAHYSDFFLCSSRNTSFVLAEPPLPSQAQGHGPSFPFPSLPIPSHPFPSLRFPSLPFNPCTHPNSQ